MQTQTTEPEEAVSECPFNEDYYLRGVEKGISNYTDYKFLADRTHEYVLHLIRHLGIKETDSVHDVGAARGYLVKSLRMHGIDATGHDISEWAVQNCDPSVVKFMSQECDFTKMSVDWVHCKDCIEHCTEEDSEQLVINILKMVRKGAFFIVPLTKYHKGTYIYPNDNQDTTHIIRYTMENWMYFLTRIARISELNGLGTFTVQGSYHVPNLKQASVDYPYSTGFYQLRRHQ